MIELTEQTFNEYINSQEKVLVDFWATWCEPCKAMVPILEDIHNETVTVAKVDVDKEMAVAKAQGIRSMPTLILYENGVETKRLIGAQPKNKVLEGLGL
jgi:thioredoxin 1